MKRLPIFLIGLMFTCFLSCKQSNQSFIISGDKDFLLRDNQIEEYMNWYYDSILNSMNDRFKIYLIKNNIKIPDFPTLKLQKIEDIFHILFDYEFYSESPIDISRSMEAQTNQLELLNLYILKELKDIVSDSLYSKLTEERFYVRQLINSQHDFLRKHFDNALDGGQFKFIKYYQVEIKILQDWQNSLKDLYFAFLIPSDTAIYKTYPYYSPISNIHIDCSYNHIIDDLIPLRPYELYRESLEPTYDPEADKIAAQNLKSTWFQFIDNREKISKFLSDDKKGIWNNATNRFKRSNLILIKNEFQGLGYCSNDILSVILPDTCSYKELFFYSNFSTKWKEYCDPLKRDNQEKYVKI